MRIENSELRLSATDLVNHLGCRLLTHYSFEKAPLSSKAGRTNTAALG